MSTTTLWKGWIKSWLDAGLAFFYPEVCQLCGAERATPAAGYVGPACRRQVQWIEPPFCQRCGMPFAGDITTDFDCSNCREMKFSFSSARAAVVASGPVLEAIHRYKYRRALCLEPFLVELLVRQCRAHVSPERCDALVPVPLYPVKERQREFNQAERLARRLSTVTQIRLDTRLVRRVKPTRTQTQLSREERAANMRQAFAPRRGATLHGERVVLVDDVFTTGATASACAAALRDAGAGSVTVWTLARGL